MSTWEERMSARAQVRIAAERERERAEQNARWAAEKTAWEAENAEAAQAAKEAGPPCAECYEWCPPRWQWMIVGHWGHIREAVVPGPEPDDQWAGSDTDPAHWCHHACHGGEPVYTIPPAMAA